MGWHIVEEHVHDNKDYDISTIAIPPYALMSKSMSTITRIMTSFLFCSNTYVFHVEEHVHDNKDYDSISNPILSGALLTVEEHVHDNKDYDGGYTSYP